jgi:predicted TIM-barrel fold metal-dependent hydrolase
VLVDHQAHWYPAAAFDLILGRTEFPRAHRAGDGYIFEPVPGIRMAYPATHVELELHLEDMERHGVDVMVSSPAGLGDVARLDPVLAVELCDVLNAEAAEAQEDHPAHFRGLAVLPLQVPDKAIAMLDEAIGNRGLHGLYLPANLAGDPVAAEDLLPVYERLAALSAPLVLHPTASSAMAPTYGRFGPAVEMVNWVFDTSAAALALIHGGVLDACPGLTVLHPHLGGALPYVAERIARAERTAGTTMAERPAAEYFRDRFFTDSVSGTPGALALAIGFYGIDRIVFATDHPWVPRRDAFSNLREELDDAQRQTVMEHNRLPWPVRTV